MAWRLIPSPRIFVIVSTLRMSRYNAQLDLNASTCFIQALHLQRDQLFLYDDRPTYARCAQWYMQQSTRNVNFPVYVLFLMKPQKKNGILYLSNALLRHEENPHGEAQHRFTVN
ncbi:hypothetical protein CEXT_240701 [Caerostris extrusa]|uniref:Ycf15 n=1 Tax=Caerostris extrusa TaxID=172846 RepID=A0AAV4PBH2_CAEEX|nr:hypothetical protein CEXT_240701 [Caerostris extrusa]